MSRDPVIALLEGLVSIRSLSGEEGEATGWLAERFRELGYERAFVDEAGNAVGEIGAESAARTVVLLGHIDTVPGEVPVRIEGAAGEERLYGRGSVDAKGPLATFAAAAGRLGGEWAREHDLRLVVVGAVEEEAATSRGARAIAARFDGRSEPLPAACVIGEPSRWDRVTLGYKGRLLLELHGRREMTHTAGPEAGIGTVGIELWNLLAELAAAHNGTRERAFDQLLPSLRRIATDSDGLRESVAAEAGLRLPPGFDAEPLLRRIAAWAAERTGVDESASALPLPASGATSELRLAGAGLELELRCRGYEPAWKGDSRNALVRSFLAAIRATSADSSPSFVVKTGTSDMNVVGPAWRCPIVAYGPGDSSLDHTPEEHVELAELELAVRVLETALRNLAPALAAGR